MSAADFKARCLESMDTVERTGRSVIVTKRGRPVAVLAPVRERRSSAYGFMKGRMQILGDIVAPVDVTWNAEQ
jgi:prevent-host-death family protein